MSSSWRSATGLDTETLATVISSPASTSRNATNETRRPPQTEPLLSSSSPRAISTWAFGKQLCPARDAAGASASAARRGNAVVAISTASRISSSPENVVAGTAATVATTTVSFSGDATTSAFSGSDSDASSLASSSLSPSLPSPLLSSLVSSSLTSSLSSSLSPETSPAPNSASTASLAADLSATHAFFASAGVAVPTALA
mmetsp:Transcript_6036/g.22818  ORF Transcript_6036/g.22818 Transcript_6036/m.22818 type:complete len:201 (+) Transcript_6036:977-1579(+)